MSIVKKAPQTMTREVKLEEPVNELLEDYARFIDSNADHVINAVLKKVLWRDQDYRKWREARRTAQAGPDKAQPIEARGRTPRKDHSNRAPSSGPSSPWPPVRSFSSRHLSRPIQFFSRSLPRLLRKHS